MRLLSLDISSQSTGWSIWKDGSLDGYGLIKTKSKDGWGKRLTEFRTALELIFDTYKPDTVCIENIYRGPSAISFKVLAFFHGVAYNVIDEKLKSDPTLISVSETRSIIGKPLGVVCKSKEQAFHIMTETFGLLDWDFKETNDIVDSFALAYAIFIKTSVQPALSLKYNKKIYSKIGESKNESVRNTGRKQGRKRK
jgi:Holliday junction resolvasome RuvABC endonuclease subunit